MDEAHSSFLLQVDALSGHCDQLARGAHLNDAALASLAATLRAAREITLALDGEAQQQQEQEGGNGHGAEGTGDAVFRTAILAQATKLIGRIRKTTPSRHEATRKGRVLIKAIALYLLWAKTPPASLNGRCERVKASAKVALDLFSETHDGSTDDGSALESLFISETLAAATYCVDAFEKIEKGAGDDKGELKACLNTTEVEAVAIGVSKALEVLLALMWRGKASSSSPSSTPLQAQQPQSAADRGASEMARRVKTLLHAALLRPALLGKRAVTVAGDVARRLTKGGQVKGARDCLVAALQALESIGMGGNTTGGGEGLGAAASAGWMRTATAALQWLLSECYSQLGDTEKALSGLQALEALQKLTAAGTEGSGEGAEGGAGPAIPLHKVELAKVAYLLRSGTNEGLRAARACVLGLAASASASTGNGNDGGSAFLNAALKGARALVGYSRYTPEAFALYDEIDKAAASSSLTTTPTTALSPVARERTLVLSTALQSTAGAAPTLQQSLLKQLVQVLDPLTTNPTAAAALTAQDRTRLRQAVRQAIWANPLKYSGGSPLAPRRLLDDEAVDGGEGSKEEQGWWGQVAALCGALLALTEEGDAQGREQALCTQSHALLELGKLSEAFAAALSACSLSPTPTTSSEPPASLLAPDGAGSKARTNLCWVACLVALKQHTTQQGGGGGDDGGPSQSPVLTVLQALLAAPAPTSAARLSGLLELATLISEAIAPHAPPLSARLLKSVLEEILRVWLTPQRPNSSSARPGSKRSRPASSSSTTTTTTSFPLTVPLSTPNANADDAATHVGFFAVCRALLEATLRCSSSSSLPADNQQQQQPESPSYPAEAFEDAGAAKECWRIVALFALPALDKLQQQQQGQQGQGGGAAVPKSLREDLRWLSTLCTNLATAKQTAATAANGPARHDLLVAAYRLFDTALQPWAGAAAATATEGDERRRVLLLMLAVSAALSARAGSGAGSGGGNGLSARERAYWLAQLGEIQSRTAALAKTPALMPLARNLRTTRLVLEVMVRASAATATASSGEEATGLSQLLAKEEGGLAALAVEVLHALARACHDPAASPASEANSAARKLYRLALKQATALAQQAGAGQPTAQAQCFWLFLDLFQAAPTMSSALVVAKEFKQRADGYRPCTPLQSEHGQEGEADKPLMALRTVAARLSVSLYNEGVSRLELVQADAATFVEEALILLPYAEEAFQANFKDQMQSMLSVAQELKSAEFGAMAAALLAGEGEGDGEGAKGMEMGE